MILNLIKVLQMVDRVEYIVFFRHIPANKLIFDTKIKSLRLYSFPKIAKLKCREIWPLQIREIKVSQKFHVIRYIYIIIYIYIYIFFL